MQFSSVSQSCPTFCDSMNRSTPGLPVHHKLLEFTQTHVHWVSDAIQPFHPQSSPSPPAANPSQHQGLFHFAWGGQSIGVSVLASVCPMNTQDWSPLGWTGWISLQFKDSQESSPTPQFKSIHFSMLSFLHSPTLTSIHDHWKNHSLDQIDLQCLDAISKTIEWSLFVPRQAIQYHSNTLDHQKGKRAPEKHLFLLYWLCQRFWLCGSQ